MALRDADAVGRLAVGLARMGDQMAGALAAAERSQIAYGVDATLQNLVSIAAVSDGDAFLDLASFAGAWYFGNNPAGTAMYDPDTGRTFDGVTFDGEINRNTGAESTIHGLLSMLVLDADPVLATRSLDAVREGAYVELGSGGRMTLDVDLPVRDVYLVMPVLHRQEISER